MRDFMTGRRIRLLMGALFTASVCGACLGGGISGTSFISGPILAIGSITVRDIKFDTSHADITIEGDPAELSDLRPGMIVYVRGRVNVETKRGVANRVAFENILKGPVEGVNATEGTFAVLSQLVVTDSSTVFDGVALATLTPDTFVEISGTLDADGNVRATRVAPQVGVLEFETQGFIENLDVTAKTFRLGLLTVDYGSALIDNEPPGGLTNGLLVGVETDSEPISGVLIAVGVEPAVPDLSAQNGDSVGLEGFITRVDSSTEFVLNGTQKVIATAATVFDGGTASDLVANAHVDVEGSADTVGRVIAEEIEFLSITGSP